MIPGKLKDGQKRQGRNSTAVTKGFHNLWDVAIRNAKTARIPSSRTKLTPSSSYSKNKEEDVKETINTLDVVNYSPSSSDKGNIAGVSGAIPCGTGYLPLMQELQRAFLMRAECPRFRDRSTSTSQWGPGLVTVSELPSGTYFKNISYDNWKMADEASLSNILRTTQTGKKLTYSKSACEFQNLRQSYEDSSSQTTIKSPQSWKIPWYATVIQEKDQHLVMMKDELRRLTALEEACLKKDNELAELKEEVKDLQKKLQFLSDVQGIEVNLKEEVSGMSKEDSSILEKKQDLEQAQKPQDSLTVLETKKSQEISICSTATYEDTEFQRGSVMVEAKEEISKTCIDIYEPFRTYEARQISISGSITKDEEELRKTIKQVSGFTGKIRKPPHLPDECDSEMEAKIIEEAENLSEGDIEGIEYLDREVEEELMARINEYEQVNEELQAELEIMRNEYSIIAGTILSLQRQVDFQKSQLQKTTLEKEMLQKELRERKAQLQAMSDKFASLREERKHDEMMGLIEKDNLNLRQHVAELEFELKKREDVISEYDNKISQLEAQVNVDLSHMRRQKQDQEQLQSRYEEMQLSEQQYRVLLENCQARLERLRSKIMQATFSTTGIKSPSTEITDVDILDALQRIINERLDFYQQLKQKGVKVPPLHQTELVSAAPKSKKAQPLRSIPAVLDSDAGPTRASQGESPPPPVFLQPCSFSTFSSSTNTRVWLQAELGGAEGSSQVLPLTASPFAQKCGVSAGLCCSHFFCKEPEGQPPPLPPSSSHSSLFSSAFFNPRLPPHAENSSKLNYWPCKTSRTNFCQRSEKGLFTDPRHILAQSWGARGQVGNLQVSIGKAPLHPTPSSKTEKNTRFRWGTSTRAADRDPETSDPKVFPSHLGMMEAQESSIQYNRWSNSQDEVSMNMTASRGVDYEGICTKLCTGKLGITMKVAGGIVLFWVIFIIGYITGYYTHKCK